MNSLIPTKSPLHRLGKNYVVYTGTVYTPSHFYVIKKKYIHRIEKYSGIIEKYLKEFPIFEMGLLEPLDIGSCAIKIAETWLRANILQTTNGFATINLVDLGGILVVNNYDLRPLPPRIKRGQGLAIRVHLENTEPKTEGPWPDSESYFLHDILTKRPLKMKGIYCRGHGDSMSLGVKLRDKPTGLDIKRILITRGLTIDGSVADRLLTDIPSNHIEILLSPRMATHYI